MFFELYKVKFFFERSAKIVTISVVLPLVAVYKKNGQHLFGLSHYIVSYV